MKPIKYVSGDATNPIGDDRKLIVHVCNDIGKWGKGFVMALSRKWPNTRSEYIKWHNGGKGFELGAVQFVKIDSDIVVCNMIGQHKTSSQSNVPPIRYGAIGKCLEKIYLAAVRNNASVHCPRFGAGLAGGSWEKIEELIELHISSKDIQVTVYDLP